MVSILTDIYIMICYAGFNHSNKSDCEKMRIQLKYMELNIITKQPYPFLTGPTWSILCAIDPLR